MTLLAHLALAAIYGGLMAALIASNLDTPTLLGIGGLLLGGYFVSVALVILVMK